MTDEQLVDLLHLSDDHQAVEHIIKRLVILNDPDFTRLIPMEKKGLDETMQDNELISYEQLKEKLPIEDEKLSDEEIKGIEKGFEDIRQGRTIKESEIDWSKIGNDV